MKNDFTEPKIYPENHDLAKSWFVAFRFSDQASGQTKQFQYRGDINKLSTKKERLREANSLKEALWDMLDSGWNPFSDRKETHEDAHLSPLCEVLDYILELKKSTLKKKSIRNYYDSIRMFKAWLIKTGKRTMLPGSFTILHARNYLDYLMVERGNSGKTVNSQMSYLHGFFSVMLDREIIQKNPFTGIKKQKHDVGKNIAFDEQEKRAIAALLRQEDIRIYYFVQFMYHCFIRRSELIRIKVGDIDWVNKTIILNSEDTKNRKQESVAIPTGFEPVLKEMHLERFPSDYYIFSLYLKPGPKQLVRPDYITRKHRELLDQLNIGKEKTLYSWKHTGVVDYYNVVKDPYPIMQQLRHHSLQITMIYLKSLGLQPNSVMRSAELTL